MMRTAFGLITWLLLGLFACSSKSIENEEGKAGSASDGNSPSAGTSAGGTSAGGANGNTSGSGGVVGRAGSSSTAGSGGSDALCTDTTVMCADDQVASLCDPLTGVVDMVNCTEEFAKDGLISNGCTVDETGAGCTIDDLADADCAAGTAPFAVCAQATQDDLIDIYVACFHDNNDVARMVITCYADYADVEAQTVDCEAADAACLPAE